MTKSEVYKILIQKFGWTPSEIADMNPFQQLLAAEIDFGASDTLNFPNMAAYQRWRMQEGFD